MVKMKNNKKYNWYKLPERVYKLEQESSSTLLEGTDRQVVGFDEEGDPIATTLGWKQFSDQSDPPPFPVSTLVFNSELPEGNQFGFGQLSEDALPITIPLRTDEGSITVPFTTNLENAVNLGQIISHFNGGVATFTGDDTTESFTIPHNLGQTPRFHICSRNADSGDNYTLFETMADSANIIVKFQGTPMEGAVIMINWFASK